MDQRSRTYHVVLSPQQRQELEQLVRNDGTAAKAKKITHARILLMSDAHHPQGRYHNDQIAAALGVHVHTVSRIRKLFCVAGCSPALERKKRDTGPTPHKLDGAAEATLVAICCSPPPDGQVRWTLKLLSQELVNRGIVTSICRETVRSTLKKTNCSPGASSGSASPRRRRRGSWPTWSRCWTCTPSHRIPSIRW